MNRREILKALGLIPVAVAVPKSIAGVDIFAGVSNIGNEHHIFIDNSNRDIDALLSGRIRLVTPQSDMPIDIYIAGNHEPVEKQHMTFFGTCYENGGDHAYVWGPTVVSQSFGGMLPEKIHLLICADAPIKSAEVGFTPLEYFADGEQDDRGGHLIKMNFGTTKTYV